jgi:hypothetical protein
MTSVADTTQGDPIGCEPSTPILQADGTPTGFVRCQDGAFERVEAVACSNPTRQRFRYDHWGFP